MLIWATMAGATMCPSPRVPRVYVLTDRLAPAGHAYLHLASDPGTLAGMLRVRGPAEQLVRVEAEQLGEILRLHPAAPWSEGRYIVEQKLVLDGSGALTSMPGVQADWYAVDTFTVGAAVDSNPPKKISWIRDYPPEPAAPAGAGLGSVWPVPSPSISTTFTLDDTAAAVLLMVDDKKPWMAVRASASAEQRVGVPRSAGVCARGPAPGWPTDGDVAVHVVAIGRDGMQRPGPSRKLGPANLRGGRPNPPSGKPAHTEAIQGFRPVSLSLDTTPVLRSPSSSCGRIQTDGRATTVYAGAIHGTLHALNDGTALRIDRFDGAIEVRGRRFPVEGVHQGSSWIQAAGTLDRLFVAVTDHQSKVAYLLRIDGGVLKSTQPMTFAGSVELYATEDEVQVQSTMQPYPMQVFDPDLTLLRTTPQSTPHLVGVRNGIGLHLDGHDLWTSENGVSTHPQTLHGLFPTPDAAWHEDAILLTWTDHDTGYSQRLRCTGVPVGPPVPSRE